MLLILATDILLMFMPTRSKSVLSLLFKRNKNNVYEQAVKYVSQSRFGLEQITNSNKYYQTIISNKY